MHDHVAKCVVLLVDCEGGGIGNLGVFHDGDSECHGRSTSVQEELIISLTSFPHQLREKTQKLLEHSSPRTLQ